MNAHSMSKSEPSTVFFEKLIPSSEVQKLTKEDMKVFRTELRTACTATKLAFDNFDMSPKGYYNGYGDSGNEYAATGNEHVDAFLHWMLNTYVTFDWYNDNGGGGDITWDIINDIVTINGYQNVTTQEDVMCEEEF